MGLTIRTEEGIFLFATKSRIDLGSTQPHIQESRVAFLGPKPRDHLLYVIFHI